MRYNFNQGIILPENLTSLTMGCWFNKPVVFPKSLTTFKMGYSFNQIIILPESLMGYDFNQSIELPESLPTFKMGMISIRLLQSLTTLKKKGFSFRFPSHFIFRKKK
jgi:hypothetical protein